VRVNERAHVVNCYGRRLQWTDKSEEMSTCFGALSQSQRMLYSTSNNTLT